VELGDVRDSDDRALGRLQPGDRLTPRLCPRWVQEFVSGLLELLYCRTYCRGIPNVEFDADLRHGALGWPPWCAEASLGYLG
jgi:hypothetical protein